MRKLRPKFREKLQLAAFGCVLMPLITGGLAFILGWSWLACGLGGLAGAMLYSIPMLLKTASDGVFEWPRACPSCNRLYGQDEVFCRVRGTLEDYVCSRCFDEAHKGQQLELSRLDKELQRALYAEEGSPWK